MEEQYEFQYVANIKKENVVYSQESNLYISSFSSPISFDEFDMNVISLQFLGIWRNSSGNSSFNFVANSSNFESIKKMIDSSKKAKILILFPENYDFRIDINLTTGKYYKIEKLKDLSPNLNIIMTQLLGNGTDSFYYEPTNISNLSRNTLKLICRILKIKGKRTLTSLLMKKYLLVK